MIRHLIIYSIVVFPLLVSAQVKISCTELTDPSAAVFYIGVENPITITGMDHPEKYSVSINGGGAFITARGNGNYIVRITRTDSATIRVNRLNKEVLMKKFSCRVFPDPVATPGGSQDSVFTKSRILANPVVQAIQRGSLFKMYIQILSFNLISGDGSESISANMGRFSEEQIAMVKRAESGSQLIFENIRCVGPDGRTRKLVPFTIRIQ